MHGTSEEIAKQEGMIKEKMTRIQKVWVVMSGKGGVGKTSVAVNLAYALAASGKSVAILDADLHGPNVAKMLGLDGKEMVQTNVGLEPAQAAPNLTVVSMALTGKDEDEAFIWRGPMKSSVIRQLIAFSEWGDLDHLIIDTPPGTGDEALSVCQMIPSISGVIIVSTPQKVALQDTRRTVKFARDLHLRIVGLVENMSGFLCPHCGKETAIFRTDGLADLALAEGLPLLARIPLDPEVMMRCDEGEIAVGHAVGGGAFAAYAQMAKKIEKDAA